MMIAATVQLLPSGLGSIMIVISYNWAVLGVIRGVIVIIVIEENKSIFMDLFVTIGPDIRVVAMFVFRLFSCSNTMSNKITTI